MWRLLPSHAVWSLCGAGNSKVPVPGTCLTVAWEKSLCYSELLIIQSTAAQGVLFLADGVQYVTSNTVNVSSHPCAHDNSTHLTVENALCSFQHALSDWTEGQLLIQFGGPQRYQLTTDCSLSHPLKASKPESNGVQWTVCFYLKRFQFMQISGYLWESELQEVCLFFMFKGPVLSHDCCRTLCPPVISISRMFQKQR